ncbi:hypothetical protein [Kitasatospora sp. MMS16-BH015]|uniref:hypothetical protein n=1 Tax=Kitasatospora sp. MMS16-BH015 TaxID=2018025 RepID=UPI00131A5C1F|nr:hypothetical protein [Kitasatospora sp. MMS16-BH015]
MVFAVAELTLGPRRTLAVGYACSLVGTCYARFGVSRPPGHLLHLPAAFAQVRDTGPSAAVIGLGLLVSWRFGARWTALGVVLLTTAMTVLDPELAGYEHMAALVTAALLLLADGIARRQAARRLTARRQAARAAHGHGSRSLEGVVAGGEGAVLGDR